MDPLAAYMFALLVSLSVFCAMWPVSVAARDVSIVDAWWGPGFFAGALTVWGLTGWSTDQRTLAVLILVGLWSTRLGFIMIRRRVRHGDEDNRYKMIRKSWGGAFWWKSFFIVFLLQGVLQWAVSLTALAVVAAGPATLGVLGAIGLVVAVVGFAVEAVADAQLDKFKKTAAPGDLLTTGLRSYMRHPNYTGEMIFWWGVWLIAADAGAWWTIVCPLLLTFLLTKVSGAPITGGLMRDTKPEFRAYAARTPAFLPRLRGRIGVAAE